MKKKYIFIFIFILHNFCIESSLAEENTIFTKKAILSSLDSLVKQGLIDQKNADSLRMQFKNVNNNDFKKMQEKLLNQQADSTIELPNSVIEIDKKINNAINKSDAIKLQKQGFHLDSITN